MKSKKRSKLLHALAVASILCVGVLFLNFAMNSKDVANRDYMCYWTAGQQLVHHANPYDGAAILQMEKAYGFKGHHPAFMRNPPWALFLALPLGFLGERFGAVLWSIAIIAALFTSIRLIWNMHGQPKDSLHLIGYMFPPCMACLLAGQIGVFLLLGVTLFQYFRKSRPFIAGTALFFCLLKPHLFLPFEIAVFVWAITQRRYRLLTGTVVAFGAAFALGFLLDPHGWSHYTAMMRGESLQDEFIPTVSLMFRLAIHRQALWLQFLPAFAASLWALWYFWRNRDGWDWMERAPLLLLVSVMVAPYAWFVDEAVLLPAILASLYVASERGRSLIPYVVLSGIALIEVMAGVIPNGGFYVWTAPTWLLWYLWAARPLINLHEREAEVITL